VYIPRLFTPKPPRGGFKKLENFVAFMGRKIYSMIPGS
jgi:hypothetical protein